MEIKYIYPYKFMASYSRFCLKIAPIYMDEGHIFGIYPDLPDGTFVKERKEELLLFCEKNSGFHLATAIVHRIIYNRYLEHGLYYYLCYGDEDPYLIYVSGLKGLNPEESTELSENEFRAAFGQQKRRYRFKIL